jgi:iron complex transport system permease protein
MKMNDLVNKYELNLRKEYAKTKKAKIITIFVILALVIAMTFVCLFVGSSNMSISESFMALFRQGSATNIKIMRNIRVSRILAALIAGAGLAVSGLIMQTTLGNVMASPSTLGVSNAAVFGANLSIIAFAGGFLSLGNNVQNFSSGANPYATSLMAFLFSFISILIILGLCKFKDFSPNSVVLAGIAIGSIWTAGTTFLQFFATDVGLSAAVIWNFGDLGRATYEIDLIMGIVVIVGVVFFAICAWKYNALLGGDMIANSLGIRVNVLRFISLLLSSLITAVCVSFLGIIGFVGIVAPHSMKRILGNDHRYSIPSTILAGSLLLLIADTLSRGIADGTALPVGAITSLIGAPFFLYLIFSNRRKSI